MQLNPPEEFVVEEHAAPSAQLTVTADFFAKLAPVNVIDVPTGPDVGLAVSVGVLAGATPDDPFPTRPEASVDGPPEPRFTKTSTDTTITTSAAARTAAEPTRNRTRHPPTRNRLGLVTRSVDGTRRVTVGGRCR